MSGVTCKLAVLLVAVVGVAATVLLLLVCCMLPPASDSRKSLWFMDSCSCVQDDERSCRSAGCGCTVSIGPGASAGGTEGLENAKEPRDVLLRCCARCWSLACACSCCLSRSATSGFAKGLSGGEEWAPVEDLRLPGCKSSGDSPLLQTDRGESPGDCTQERGRYACSEHAYLPRCMTSRQQQVSLATDHGEDSVQGDAHNLDIDTVGQLAVVRRRTRLPPICQWSDDACAADTFAGSVHDMPEVAELTTGMSGPQFPFQAQNSAGDMLADRGSVSQGRSASSAVAAMDRLGYPPTPEGTGRLHEGKIRGTCRQYNDSQLCHASPQGVRVRGGWAGDHAQK